jgi:hypothetical protein
MKLQAADFNRLESQLKWNATGHQHDNTISNQKNDNENNSSSKEHNNH